MAYPIFFLLPFFFIFFSYPPYHVRARVLSLSLSPIASPPHHPPQSAATSGHHRARARPSPLLSPLLSPPPLHHLHSPPSVAPPLCSVPEQARASPASRARTFSSTLTRPRRAAGPHRHRLMLPRPTSSSSVLMLASWMPAPSPIRRSGAPRRRRRLRLTYPARSALEPSAAISWPNLARLRPA